MGRTLIKEKSEVNNIIEQSRERSEGIDLLAGQKIRQQLLRRAV